MKTTVTLLVWIVFGWYGYSQNSPIVLHPLVGDTIDKNEKIKYLLFPEINASDFKYGTISRTGNGYVLRYFDEKNNELSQSLDSSSFRQYRINLEKLNDYYSNQEKGDTLKVREKSILEQRSDRSHELKSKFVDDKTKDDISKEAIRNARLKDDAERRKQFENGNDLTGGGAYIEFSKKKKKK